MLSLAQIQSEFFDAVCDVHKPVPSFVEDGRDASHRKTRFDIYRNNFYVAVINVLRERFPVTERIVGDDFFKAMARDFVEATPPRGQSNLSYGEAFPTFFESFEHVEDLPYLPDVARIEWARFCAAIAPDIPVVTSNALSSVDPAQASLVRFVLHPSCSILVSGFPVYDIWRTNHEDEDVKRLSESRDGQAVLVARSVNGVEVYDLAPGRSSLLAALAAGKSIGESYESVAPSLPQHELSETLALLLSSGAVADINVRELSA